MHISPTHFVLISRHFLYTFYATKVSKLFSQTPYLIGYLYYRIYIYVLFLLELQVCV